MGVFGGAGNQKKSPTYCMEGCKGKLVVIVDSNYSGVKKAQEGGSAGLNSDVCHI